MEALIPVLGSIKDPTVLVLILVIVALGYLHIVTLRENRTDRQALLDLLLKTNENQNKITEALNGLRNAISAYTGKAA